MNILLVARAGVMREAVLRGSSRTKKWFPEPSIKSTFSFASSDQCFANCHGDPRYVYAHPSMLVGYDTLYLKWPTNRIDRFSDHILSASTTSHDEHLDRQGNQPGPLIAKRGIENRSGSWDRDVQRARPHSKAFADGSCAGELCDKTGFRGV